MIKSTKAGKVRCPECNKLQHPLYDDEKNVMVLECCRTWSLFPKGSTKIKVPRPDPEIDEKAELLRRLYNGKKEKSDNAT